jgi:uncharacterized repeat protein (TIGR02543 family)
MDKIEEKLKEGVAMKRCSVLLSCLSLVCLFVILSCDTPANENGIPSRKMVFFNNDGVLSFASDIVAGDTVAYRYMEKPGYSLDGWYIDDQYNTAWDFDHNIVTDNIVLYAKWLNILPGEVVITDCLYNADNNSVDIYYTTPNDIDLDYLIMYVDDILYDNFISKTNAAASLYYDISNGAVVTIKTVDTAGLVSDGVDYTIDIPGYTPTPNWMALVLSDYVILKYPDRLEPSAIGCSFKAFTNYEDIILNDLPAGWTLELLTSAQSSPPYMIWNGPMPFEEPIPVDRSWAWVEFILRKGNWISDAKRVLIQ